MHYMMDDEPSGRHCTFSTPLGSSFPAGCHQADDNGPLYTVF